MYKPGIGKLKFEISFINIILFSKKLLKMLVLKNVKSIAFFFSKKKTVINRFI